mgnify:CR=1 FL=1|tara:strand:+ start:758 stop:940 length:183 start_codon:yes stop_codon:yes gene_type:complete
MDLVKNSFSIWFNQWLVKNMIKGIKIVGLAGSETPDEVKLDHPFMGKHWLFEHSESLLHL